MKTLFIGFTRNVGTFPDKQTGELIPYSNRNLRFITDSGSGGDNVGFTQFNADKMKLGQLAKILGVRETDNDVDNALSALLSKAVNTQFAPVNNEMKLIWFSPAETK